MAELGRATNLDNRATSKRIWGAIIPLAFAVLAAFQDPLFAASPLKGAHHGWPIFFFGYGVILPILVMTLFDRGPGRIVQEIGLTANPWPALLFVALALSPAIVGFALEAKIDPDLKADDIIWGALFFPFVEETFFRGVLFGQLYQRAGWRFWPAALISALPFAAGHLYQSQDPAEIAQILAITGTGAVVFSYLFVQWSGNLWVPFFAHAGLNMLWTVFAVSDTALGDTFANVLRFGSIGFALALCFLGRRAGWLRPLANS